jgi:cytochrome bd-type quinol oxidase subunit 2
VLGAVKLTIIATSVGWFIGRFHLLGGVLVSLVAVLFGKTVALLRVGRHMNVGLAGLLPWSDLAVTLGFAVAAGLPVLLLRDHFALRPLPSILLGGLVYALAFATLAGGWHAWRLRRRPVSLLEAER